MGCCYNRRSWGRPVLISGFYLNSKKQACICNAPHTQPKRCQVGANPCRSHNSPTQPTPHPPRLDPFTRSPPSFHLPPATLTSTPPPHLPGWPPLPMWQPARSCTCKKPTVTSSCALAAVMRTCCWCLGSFLGWRRQRRQLQGQLQGRWG